MVGFITNQMFDTPKVVHNTFDSTMPREHYPKKRKEDLKTLSIDQQITIRVDDLPKEIRYPAKTP